MTAVDNPGDAYENRNHHPQDHHFLQKAWTEHNLCFISQSWPMLISHYLLESHCMKDRIPQEIDDTLDTLKTLDRSALAQRWAEVFGWK